MKRFYLQTVLLSFLLVSCAGQAANAQSGEPVFNVTAKNTDDQIDIQYDDGTALIDITSPSGIGSATLELESGGMPEEIILRLHLRGLEELQLTSDQTSIAASVSNSDPTDIRQRILAASSDTPLLPDQPLWMKVKIVSEQPVNALPMEEGYFEVTIPKEFIQKAGTSFEIAWIDFHR
jgi:hypothetical protein